MNHMIRMKIGQSLKQLMANMADLSLRQPVIQIEHYVVQRASAAVVDQYLQKIKPKNIPNILKKKFLPIIFLPKNMRQAASQYLGDWKQKEFRFQS